MTSRLLKNQNQNLLTEEQKLFGTIEKRLHNTKSGGQSLEGPKSAEAPYAIMVI